MEQDTEERLKSLAEKYGTEIEGVEALFNEVRNDPTRVSTELEAEQAERRAVNVVGAMLARKARSKTSDYFGMFVGVDVCKDRADIKRNIAKKEWAADKARAIKGGFCDAHGNFLETTGFNKGKPLPEHDYSRLSMGVCKEWGSEDAPTQFRLWANRETAEAAPPMYRWIKFNAIPAKNQRGDILTLNSSKYTEFTPIEAEVPVEEGVNWFVNENPLTNPAELEDKYNEAQRQGRKRAFVVTYGIVSDISMTTDSRGYRYLMLYDIDAEEEIRLRVPDHVPIDFSVNSTIYVIGSLYRGDRLDRDTNTWVKGEGGWTIDCYGVWGVPGQTVAPDEPPSQEAVDDALDELDTSMEELE